MAREIYPPWDGVEPLDVYRWRRDRELRKQDTAAMPMMRAVDDQGDPLYRMTASGNWARTKPLPTSTRRSVLARDGLACIWCGSAESLEVDHIVRYIDGGGNHPNNLRTLCADCHGTRGGQA